MASIALPIASYQLPHPVGSSARLVNCHSQPAPQGGKAAIILQRSAGISTLATLDAAANSVGRGAIKMNGVLYVLVNTTLWRVSSSWVGTSVGTIPGSDRVKMSTNGSVIVIVRPSSGLGYSCDGSTTSQIVDAVFTGFGAADVAFIHGYFVFRRPNSGQFFNSGLNALTFDALDIAEAEQVPDNLLALTVDHEDVLLLGTDSSELWYDAANESGSPFSKSPGGVVTMGLAGPDAHGHQDNATFMLATDRTFRRLSGVTPLKVSQFGIDAQLQRLSQVSDGYTVSYTTDGHMFIAWIFPFDGRAFVYDCSTQQWHERESFGADYWRPAEIVECYGKQVVVDSISGKIGYIDTEAMTEFGDPQSMSWTYQAVYAENRLAVHRRFELVVNSGHGLLTGQGSNPVVTLEISDDGGETFRTLPTKSLGLRGKYGATVYWDQLGSARQRVYRVSISDPIPVMTVDTILTADGARV